MKKLVLCLSLALAALAANADELATADALFQKKAYPQALQLYTKLANAGNVDAQRHLAEMYWYGEAGSVDDAKAELWFRKAAAKGDKTAVAALEVMKQRVARRAEIDYWVNKYDGADLKSGKFRCVAPRIPAISKVNDDITRIGNNVQAWQDCYNDFVANMNAHETLASVVPEDLLKLFNEQETAAATARLAQAREGIAAESSAGAKLTLADFAAWRSATEAWVKDHNDLVKSSTASDRSNELDARRNNYVPNRK
ncbi:sel1 repeat family protein [Massilia sp. R2A-15]|uniref:tetratricopeptide repeat protein n=1 Tax=Massilia sp. R2A-15 TaxID=3064278 RepID=UPI002736875F|nr:sel1 repeat family protein [Massilia sp. R2A-15]WLI87739.1 sel1 repeat family protein [Massilia sp. R2A-15]